MMSDTKIKVMEAFDCADAGAEWRRNNLGKWRGEHTTSPNDGDAI
jgi:hypothetical protein